MSEGVQFNMAPDGHTLAPDPGQADTQVQCRTATPVTNGILSKGKKARKRVRFRDHNLCTFKEIPPRSRSASSEESDDEEDDDEDNDDDDDDDDDSDTDSDEEVTKPAAKGKPAAQVLRPSPVVPVHHAPRVRPERAPIVWSSTTSYNVAKGSYDVSTSPASKVVSLVSHITGVSSSAAQAHIKQRAAPSPAPAPSPSPTPKASPSPTPRPSPSPTPKAVPAKKPVTVVKVEKKVKKITPTLDNVMSPLTTKSGHHSGHKHGATSDSSSKGSKAVRKKRVCVKKSDSGEKRKAVSRKGKDHHKHRTNSPVPDRPKHPQPLSAASVRDSLSLPRLGADDTLVTQSSKSLQQLSLGKLYTLDGFIFPGDPAHDLAASVSPLPSPIQNHNPLSPTTGSKAAVPASATASSTGLVPRERISSAPPTSASRRKRYYAWQMANGNMQSTLQETPCIAPMWETVQTVSLPNRPGSVADR